MNTYSISSKAVLVPVFLSPQEIEDVVGEFGVFGVGSRVIEGDVGCTVMVDEGVQNKVIEYAPCLLENPLIRNVYSSPICMLLLGIVISPAQRFPHSL